MGQKIIVGPIQKGFRNDVTPFNVDNDAFPTLTNAYQWRGRVKRKRGTSFLARLQRTLVSQSLGNTDGSGAFSGNIFSILSLNTSQPNASIVPGSISITCGTQTFSDANSDGVILQQTGVGYVTAITNITLPTSNTALISLADPNYIPGMQVYISGVSGMTQINNAYYTITVVNAGVSITVTTSDNSSWSAYTSGGVAKRVSGSINYATGALAFQTTPALAATPVDITFAYFPNLPVMGLEQLQLDPSADTQQLGFDTIYAYNIPITSPYTPYSVSWYKNPIGGSINGITYTAKATATPVVWNGQNYQQFWSTNYQGAFWVTNGITEPFSITNVGMQYKPCASVVYVSATQLTITITEAAASLVIGDWVFINEVTGTNSNTVNMQTGFVTASANAAGTTTLTVRFPYAAIDNQVYAAGILQYLTSFSDATKDCIRWYDGDPTSGANHQPPTPPTGMGWVNFCPPLMSGVDTTFNIADLPTGQYYLVTAKMIIPYKDRLLFLGPVVQTSAAGSQKYLPDTIIYSQNGVPYYTASFPGAPSATQTYTALLTPGWISPTSVGNQTAQPSSFWENQAGFGGFIQAGIASPITTASQNEDTLIVGFKSRQTRLVYTGNDIIPFNFYTINTELGSEATFSFIDFDRGIMTVGGRGIILTSQVSSQRIDLQIPSNVFEIKLTGNGGPRICSFRDYQNEWASFTYKSNQSDAVFPNQTLFYNYRDESWAIFNETYTTYGTFRPQTGYTWATIGSKYATWSVWNDPWNSGETTLLQPQPIGGNAQGFILFLAEGTNEGNSAYIKSITTATSTISSPGHCLNDGDFILVSGVLGTLSTQMNNQIFQVSTVDSSGAYTPDSFVVSPTLTSGTYIGGGLFKRMYIPYVQTRQFPVAWQFARKTRIGPQQYLLTRTNNAQITLLIFLSQNGADAYNDPEETNDSLIYTSILYTCPELSNLGLSAANINLQMPTGGQQNQIWHRMNTSLLGDTVQIGFTLSEDQMTAPLSGSAQSITGATKANPCVLTCSAQFAEGTLIYIQSVSGMVELNGNNYVVLSSTPTTVTIAVDSTNFTTYVSGGTATLVPQNNQFAEIEFHSMVLDVNPSQILA